MESELSQKLKDVNEINRETEESSLNVLEKFDYPESFCDIFIKENWHDEIETSSNEIAVLKQQKTATA